MMAGKQSGNKEHKQTSKWKNTTMKNERNI